MHGASPEIQLPGLAVGYRTGSTRGIVRLSSLALHHRYPVPAGIGNRTQPIGTAGQPVQGIEIEEQYAEYIRRRILRRRMYSDALRVMDALFRVRFGRRVKLVV